MQAGAHTLPHPIAEPERLAVAAPIDRPQRDNAESESQSEHSANPNTDSCGGYPVAERVTIELG